MTFGDFLTQTRKKWVRAFRTLKKSDKSKKKMASSPSRSSNRVSPDSFLDSYSGTVDARQEIQIEKFCKCGTQSDPPFPNLDESRPLSTYENASFNYDSAYDTDQSSPKSCRTSESSSFTVHHATVSYYHVKDKEDTSSISTELTWLEYDLDESENLQNVVNERIELMTSL